MTIPQSVGMKCHSAMIRVLSADLFNQPSNLLFALDEDGSCRFLPVNSVLAYKRMLVGRYHLGR